MTNKARSLTETANSNLHNFNAAASISLNFVMANRLMLSNFRQLHSPTSSMTPGSRETPRFNPAFPSNNFAASSPAVPSTTSNPRHHPHPHDPLELDDEKYDRNLDVEAEAGAGGIEMERKCSGTTTLADPEDTRSVRSKVSDGTFQISGTGQNGIEEEIDGNGGNEKVEQETISNRV
jgi:hypothetical protein